MGMCMRPSKSSYDSKPRKVILPNPNPKRCVIEYYSEIGKCLIILVNYLDSKNFEGNKILVYKNATIIDLTKQLQTVGIDPHFSDNSVYHSPIARFIPTDEGKEMAIKLCRMLEI